MYEQEHTFNTQQAAQAFADQCDAAGIKRYLRERCRNSRKIGGNYWTVTTTRVGKRGLSFKTRCLYEIDERQSRREQQRNDRCLLAGVIAIYAVAIATAVAIVS